MTLGQEFHGFATTLGEDHSRLKENAYLLYEINMGATAIGTGITTHPDYSGGGPAAPAGDQRARPRPRRPTSSSRRATPARSCRSRRRSSAMRSSCRRSATTCGCSRRGPQAGFGEINLPARQAGSSIMPGKVNPVIPEVVNQVAFAVAGADLTVTMAVEGGQLQLNAFEPVIAHSIFQSITWMRRGMRTLRVNCVDGITANRERLGAMVGASVGVITALTPFIGYAAAAALAKTALLTGPQRRRPRRRGRAHVARRRSPSSSRRARLSGLEAITAAIPVVRPPRRSRRPQVTAAAIRCRRRRPLAFERPSRSRGTPMTDPQNPSARANPPTARRRRRPPRPTPRAPPAYRRRAAARYRRPTAAGARRTAQQRVRGGAAARVRCARVADRSRQDDGHRRVHPVVLRPARSRSSSASSRSCRAGRPVRRTAGRVAAIIISSVLIVVGIIVAIII